MNGNTQRAKKQDTVNSPASAVEWWLKLAALIGAVVSLLGYGVVTGLASAINLDHGSMLGGPFELLSLVWPGVMLLITGIDKIDFLSVIGWSFSQAFPVALVAFALIVLLSALMRYKGAVPRINWEWFKAKVVPGENETVRTVCQKATFFAISSFTAVTFATLVGFVGIFGILLCLLTVPVIGFSAGRAYFNEYVLKPTKCVSVVPGNLRLEAKKNASSEVGVACALLKSIDKDKPYLNHGRVVLSSPGYMLMYHFDTGVGERIPVASLIIQSIDDAGIAALRGAAANRSGNDARVEPRENTRRPDGVSQ